MDHDLTLVLDDIRLVQDASVSADFDNRHDGSHAGRMGNLILTNGSIDARYDVKRGERLRLRLINAANARVFQLGLHGLEGWVVALDGMPLQTPERPGETFALAPAQRMDLIVDVVAEDEAFLVQFDRSGGYAQATFECPADQRLHAPCRQPFRRTNCMRWISPLPVPRPSAWRAARCADCKAPAIKVKRWG